MKTFAACIRAEFRRALPILPWLAGCHAFALAIRTRWAGEVSSQLAAITEWTTWALALLVVVISLWWDAPLRRDRFLATRPLRFLPLLRAKWVALVLIAVLPFAVVDFIALRFAGVRGGFLALATLQACGFHLAALCALFPAVWWWRSRATAFTALGITFAALMVTGALLAHLHGNRNLHGGKALGFPVNTLLIVVMLAGFALGAFMLWAPFAKRAEWLRISVFAALAGASLYCGLWVSIRPPAADEVKHPSLVSVSQMTPGYQDVGYEWFHAGVPPEPQAPEIDVIWSFSKLRVNGRDLRPWQRRKVKFDTTSYQVHHALARHFGSAFRKPDADGTYYSPNIAILPENFPPEPPHAVEMEILETRCRWEVVVDMPLKAGATATLPEGSLRVTRFSAETAMANDPKLRFSLEPVLEVRALLADVWGAGLEDSIASLHPCIVDPQTGTVWAMGFKIHTKGFGNPKVLVLQLPAFQIDSLSRREDGLDFPHDLRFVVLRPHVIKRVAHAWESREVPRLKTRFAPSGRVESEPSQKDVDIFEWLARHPVPAESGTSAEAESWLLRFIPVMRDNHHQIRDRDPWNRMLEKIGPLVTHHPEVVLRHAGSGQVEWLLQSAIRKYLPRDTAQRFPDFATNRYLTETYISRGWAADLAETARTAARGGLSWTVDNLLRAVPREIGLSQDEWLDFFRLSPSAETYQALADTVIPRDRLDREVDARLALFRVRPAGYRTPDLELALARGRQEAPRWLKQDYEALSRSPFHSGALELLEKYFDVLPVPRDRNFREARDRQVEWFLSIDPDRFVFDPAKRRYVLTETR
jgi:hypothetical protein